MAKREGRGGYAGGGTGFSARNPSWFSKDSTHNPLLRESVVQIPARSLAEQAEYEAFKAGRLSPVWEIVKPKQPVAAKRRRPKKT